MRKLSLFFFALILVLLSACEKDSIDPKQEIQEIAFEQNLSSISIPGDMSFERAKAIFYQNKEELIEQSFTLRTGEMDDCNSMLPIWMLAKEIKSARGDNIIIVPLELPEDQVLPGMGAQLIFYDDPSCETPVELMLYKDSNASAERENPIDNCSFTGTISISNFCDCSHKLFAVEAGAIELYTDSPNSIFTECDNTPTELETRDEEKTIWDWIKDWWNRRKIKCWDGGGKNDTWKNIKEFFNGNGSTTGYAWAQFNLGNWNISFPSYSGNNGTVGGGSSSNQINDLFDGNIFEGEGEQVRKKLEEIIDQHDLFICSEVFHQLIHPCLEQQFYSSDLAVDLHPNGCAGGSGTTDYDYSMDMYIRDLKNLQYLPDHPCLAAIIEEYQKPTMDIAAGDGMLICFIEENNNFDMEDKEIFEEIKDKCGTDEICQIDVFDCLGRLEEFQNTYEMTLNAQIVDEIVFNSISEACTQSYEDFDITVKKAVLLEALDLLEDEMVWLEIQDEILIDELFVDLINNNYSEETLIVFIWCMLNQGETLSYFKQKYDEWANDGDPPGYEGISNIQILESSVPDYIFDPDSPVFAETPYRNGHEYDPPSIIPDDLRSGTDGDQSLVFRIYRKYLDDPVEELGPKFLNMLTSDWYNQDLKFVAERYYNTLMENDRVFDYFDQYLSEYVRNNDHMIITVKDFGDLLNEKLNDANGDINAVSISLTEGYRPIFNDGELHSGLKILINDSEKMNVYLFDNYEFNSETGDWTAEFYFQIFDNFGLDDADIQFQTYDSRFAIWWILQHVKGKVPFRTEIRNVFKISGNIHDYD